jgi:hypothetical protein
MQSVTLLAIVLALNFSPAAAQTERTQSKDRPGIATSEFDFSRLLAQLRPARRGGFSLMPSSRTASFAGPSFGTTPMAAGPNLPVLGGGMPGRITKWTGLTSSNAYIGDTTIFEDKFGKVGIGTDTPTSKLTVQGMIEMTLGGLKFPDGTVQTTAFDPNLVVRSLNGLRGDLFLAAGANITVMPSGGNTLTIAAPNVLTSVFHNSTLTGTGTAASPLGISDGGVNTTQLANNAVTSSKIASGQVVKSLNNLKDDVTIAAGSNITITPSGNTLTLAATAGLSSVSHDSSLKGNGTSASPLGVNAPLALSAAISDSAVISGTNNSTGLFAIGVFGTTASNGGGTGVLGVGGSQPDGTGVKGVGRYGVIGESSSIEAIRGSASGNALAGNFLGNVVVHGDLEVTGDKDFVEPHPTDPNKMIAYVALEGPEAGTYFRGSGRIVNGLATVEVPEDFRIVTDEKGITVQVTPIGEPAMIWCVRKSLEKIELRGSADVEFDFMVNGVRLMSKDRKAIVENTVFVPRTPNDDSLTKIKKPEAIRRLKATGILNEDGSINMETVQKLDAYKRLNQL